MRHLPHLKHQQQVIPAEVETMVLVVEVDEEEAGEADIGK